MSRLASVDWLTRWRDFRAAYNHRHTRIQVDWVEEHVSGSYYRLEKPKPGKYLVRANINIYDIFFKSAEEMTPPEAIEITAAVLGSNGEPLWGFEPQEWKWHQGRYIIVELPPDIRDPAEKLEIYFRVNRADGVIGAGFVSTDPNARYSG